MPMLPRPRASPSAPMRGSGVMSRRPTTVSSTVASMVSGRRLGAAELSFLPAGTMVSVASTSPLTSPGVSYMSLLHSGVGGVLPPASMAAVSGR